MNQSLEKLKEIDIFKIVEGMVSNKENFVGVPIDLDFENVNVMVNDYHKLAVKGIPQNCFLICVKPGMKKTVEEIILLRVLQPTRLPAQDSLLASKVEYFKEFMPTGESDIAEKLDPHTKHEFQYSGIKCRLLGTFYKYNGVVNFGADVENFLSSHNYLVYKPCGDLLKYIVNFSSSEKNVGGSDSSRIGILRYSSMLSQEWREEIPIFIRTRDLLANRTALFGMTRTGKSNTVKKIIDSTMQLAKQEKRKIGQIIFDINGEYANANKQDEGTAIAEKYKDQVIRYSIIDKDGFTPMRANFYAVPDFAMQIITPFLVNDTAVYMNNFKAISFESPDPVDRSAVTRHNIKVAAFKCILAKAGFERSGNVMITFDVNKEIRQELCQKINRDRDYSMATGISIEEATVFFEDLWTHYRSMKSLESYRNLKNRDWADEDLKSLLKVLTRKEAGAVEGSVAGYRRLMHSDLRALHTSAARSLFEDDIVEKLREGKLVIVDLSEGAEITRRTYSEKIVKRIFIDSMQKFIRNETEVNGFNVVQLYFEEAHNLFPKKDNSDLSDIYNRLAKEGSKYNLGINYATQEVSSISSNILKNTQNWFVSHLNNTEEIRELTKFYDFKDYEAGVLRITDKGFLRIKTYSNDYVIPVQIDKFTAEG